MESAKKNFQKSDSIPEGSTVNDRLTEEFYQKRKRNDFFFKLLLLMAIAGSTSSLIASIFGNKNLIEKNAIQADIVSIITNGGDLEAVKHSLLSQPTSSRTLSFLTQRSSYYTSDVPLSTVLKDIRVKAFRDASKDLLPILDPIIIEYEQVNPFDKLQVGQKDYFENIRIKSGDEYHRIVNDINGIADELHEKNMLVEEYLGDSKMSFWISIFAVLISILIGGYQMYTGRPEVLKSLLNELHQKSTQDAAE